MSNSQLVLNNPLDLRGQTLAVFSLPGYYEIILNTSGWFVVYLEGDVLCSVETMRLAMNAVHKG